MRGAQDKVNAGVEKPHYILRRSPRPRETKFKKAAMKAASQFL